MDMEYAPQGVSARVRVASGRIPPVRASNGRGTARGMRAEVDMKALARGAAMLGVVLGGAAALAGCAGPLAVEPGDPVFEVVTTGGIAGIDQRRVYHADGRAECAGDLCPDGVAALDPALLEDLLRDLARAGYFAGPDRDYGADCCDQFLYTFTARSASRSRTVEGTRERLPAVVVMVIDSLRRLGEEDEG